MVDRIYHLDRGYDRMEAKLRALGADIERVEVTLTGSAVITLALSKGRIFDETLPLLPPPASRSPRIRRSAAS